MSWKLHIETPLDSVELLLPYGGNVWLNDISDLFLGVVLGSRSFSERMIKFNDAWIAAGDATKGKQLLEEEVAVFPYKGEVRLSVPINWTTKVGENNYGWQLHSLDFLKNLVRLHSDGMDPRALVRLEEIVCDWAAQNLCMSMPSLLSWNDHAAAIRLGVLGHIYMYLVRRASGSAAFLRLILQLSFKHQKILMDDAFHSKGTNHGLDQAFQLYLSSLIFPDFIETTAGKSLAMERLQYEIDVAFAADGVHVENSPQYHPVILSSVLQINSTVSNLGGQAPITNLGAFLKAALRFLAYILRPDGLFPGIGDSELAPVRNNLVWLSSFKGWDEFKYATTKGLEGRDYPEWNAVFQDAGYMVFRGNPAWFSHVERPHIVFKCGFLSRYHRHDDDTSFVLHALGEDWLIDGGLYIHDHGVPEREYMRSALAHNLTMPVGAAAVRQPGDGKISRILEARTENGDAYVVGETRMFSGFLIQRRLYYGGGLQLEIVDSCEADSDEVQLYRQFWHVPGEHSVDISEHSFTIKSNVTGNLLVVNIHGKNIIKIEKASAVTGSLGIWSREYNKLEAATVVRVDILGKRRLECRATLEIMRSI